MRWVIICVRAASRFVPKTWGSRAALGGVLRVCAARKLATLAGISSEYYLRPEQGRATHPSAQVVYALAGALRLDARATEYLHQLATTTSGRREPGVVDVAAHGMAELIDQLPMPAFVGSRWLDVLAANPLARALCPGIALGRKFLC